MSTFGYMRPYGYCLLALGLFLPLPGCGTTKERSATEQLLLSDAVDRSIAQVDFRELSGQKVYFDTQYIGKIKGTGVVNSEYIISSLRQQLVAAGCRLQDKKEDADFVVEARVGTLGADQHELVYGVPANNALSAAASAVPNAPSIPTIPEISIAKKNDQLAAAKVAAFAYKRETKEPVWQSGLVQARSDAKDVWVFGAGPFQRGTIFKGTQLAGSKIELPLSEQDEQNHSKPLVSFGEEHYFQEEEKLPTFAEEPREIDRTSHERSSSSAELSEENSDGSSKKR